MPNEFVRFNPIGNSRMPETQYMCHREPELNLKFVHSFVKLLLGKTNQLRCAGDVWRGLGCRKTYLNDFMPCKVLQVGQILNLRQMCILLVHPC
jgi:hypothetical protein